MRTGQIPFTPEAKRALELALREALGLHHNGIGTEHLLLGLVRVDTEVFGAHGLTGDRVREALLAALSNVPESPWERAIDIYTGEEPWADAVAASRAQGWEIVRVTVERRRRRSGA